MTAGTITAASLDQAGQLLKERNLFVIRIASEATREPTARPRGHASRSQVAWMFAQLSIMVETGIRLTDALDCLARQGDNARLKALLQNVSQTVQEGHSLSEAMERYPRSFPPSLTALIRSSEMSGTMGKVLRRTAQYLMKDMQIMRRVRAAILYPAFMFAVCLGVTFFLLTVILPRFAAIFASRGALLPTPTRVLMAISDNLIQNWSLWLVGTAVFIAAMIVWFSSNAGERMRDHMIVTLPILAGVFRPLFQCRAFRTLAVLLDSGVTLLDAIVIVQRIVPNTRYRELWREVEASIQHGRSMAEPFTRSDLIPEPVALMIESGERSAMLGSVFAQLADYAEEEYDQKARTATQFIEPVMILLVGTIIGFVAGSLMLPLFQAGRVVAG